MQNVKCQFGSYLYVSNSQIGFDRAAEYRYLEIIARNVKSAYPKVKNCDWFLGRLREIGEFVWRAKR